MNEKLYDLIYDALCQASDILEDLSNPDFDKQYNKINKAIDKLYEWYNNEGIYNCI